MKTTMQKKCVSYYALMTPIVLLGIIISGYVLIRLMKPVPECVKSKENKKTRKYIVDIIIYFLFLFFLSNIIIKVCKVKQYKSAISIISIILALISSGIILSYSFLIVFGIAFSGGIYERCEYENKELINYRF
tara:strand:+ start:348 stop:746 length:399 start_codon:yes stop_codon:yes gene_type:complete